MRQILFHIPLDRPWNLGPLGQAPGFGFGLVLAIWVLFGAWYALQHLRETGWKVKISDECSSIATWVGIAALIVFGAPALGKYLEVNGSPNFKEGPPIFGYGLMLFMGISSAAYLAARRAERSGVSSEVIWDLAGWIVIPGILGARLFYLIQYHDEVFAGVPVSQWPVIALNFSQGGIVLYGGLLAGAVGYFSFCYQRRIRPLGLADIIVPSVFVGIGFGRIGCFLNGCCYCRACQLPWAVQFPKESTTFSSMLEKQLVDASASCTPLLHPTQIYSSIDGFMIAIITSWYFWRRRRNGEVLAVALIIYPVTRFCMELLRADEVGKFGTTLTISQWISISLFLVNIPYMIYLSRQPAVREPVVSPEDVVPTRAPAVATATR